MKFFLLLFILFVSISAEATRRPYKILIIADAASVTSANAYRTYLMNKRPFSRMNSEDLQIEVQSVPPADMACTNPGGVNNRLINCNNDNLRNLRRDANANLAVAFTSTATGGAGGEIPIATSNFADYPIATMFHEMLHNYGFADEYDYTTETEYQAFCTPPRNSPNAAFFADAPPYANDGEGRSRHNSDVPWMGRIDAATLVTHGTALGTTTLPALAVGGQVIGLFEGGSCSLHLKTWRPYQQ